jgi:indolepyruvate ferredoxin oxidoreductase
MLEHLIGDRMGAAVLLRSTRRSCDKLLGDALGANLMLVGYAWQRGLIPLARSIERATG